jgi:Golgi apyrase
VHIQLEYGFLCRNMRAGLSSFAGNAEDIPTYLAPLLDHARTVIPPSLHSDTPIFVLATAGMRLLSPEAQANVLEATCHFLRFHSNFRIDEPSQDGPCGRSVRIITGQEEGMFGWIAVNYLMDGFGSSDADRTTYGFLDMGGASTQIAFEPGADYKGSSDGLFPISLRMLGGEEIRHRVFVATWLGYGTNQARERYARRLLDKASDESYAVHDACLPTGLRRTETPLHSSDGSPQFLSVVGTGSFAQCLAETEPLLNKAAPCGDIPCPFDGIHVPPIDFSVSHFIGVSEYWYSSEHVFGLGGAYDFVQYERAAQEYCGQNWENVLAMHEADKAKASAPAATAANAGVEFPSPSNSRADKIEIARLEMQCFKAAWIVNILHEGLGMPRIVDAGGNSSTHGDEVAEQAERKGLGRTKPAFQSMDTIGGIAITWTLGKMVLEASSEVPLPSGKQARPLEDPLQNLPADAPVQPIRPPFHFLDTIENRIGPHLPQSLSRESLGFSFIGFVFYCFVCILLLSLIYRFRHRLRILTRKLTQPEFTPKRGYDRFMNYTEEGWGSRPQTPITPSGPMPKRWMRNLRRLASFWRTRKPSFNQHFASAPPIRRVPPSPSRASPIHPHLYTASLYTGDASVPPYGNRQPSSPRGASPSTPVFAFAENSDGSEALEASSRSLYSSRSRNSSTISLSTLTVRQPLSRTASEGGVH